MGVVVHFRVCCLCSKSDEVYYQCHYYEIWLDLAAFLQLSSPYSYGTAAISNQILQPVQAKIGCGSNTVLSQNLAQQLVSVT